MGGSRAWAALATGLGLVLALLVWRRRRTTPKALEAAAATSGPEATWAMVEDRSVLLFAGET